VPLIELHDPRAPPRHLYASNLPRIYRFCALSVQGPRFGSDRMRDPGAVPGEDPVGE
jgi:hypothetical protein